ncbi:MAG: hypothetical protein ACK5TA_06055, partial [bacterium]
VNHAYRVGSAENADRIFNIISDKEIPEVVKTEALRLLAIWEKPNPVDPLSGKWRPLAPRSLDTLKPSLVKAIPKLLSANEQALSGALDLSMTYKLGADSISSDK